MLHEVCQLVANFVRLPSRARKLACSELTKHFCGKQLPVNVENKADESGEGETKTAGSETKRKRWKRPKVSLYKTQKQCPLSVFGKKHVTSILTVWEHMSLWPHQPSCWNWTCVATEVYINSLHSKENEVMPYQTMGVFNFGTRSFMDVNLMWSKWVFQTSEEWCKTMKLRICSKRCFGENVS